MIPSFTGNEHLGNIFANGELTAAATIRKFRIVQKEGKREVAREVEFYNLDAIIAVGSKQPMVAQSAYIARISGQSS